MRSGPVENREQSREWEVHNSRGNGNSSLAGRFAGRGVITRHHTQEWVRSFGLGDESSLVRLFAADCGSFAASIFPRADDVFLDLASDYLAWLILFDDAVGECWDRPAVVKLMTALSSYSNQRDDSPFLKAVHDIERRAARLSLDEESWTRRFRGSVYDYMRGCLAESVYRTEKVIPPYASYTSFRKSTIGALPLFDMVELFALPPEAMITCGDWKHVRVRAAFLCALANDLHSYEREKGMDDAFNMITVIAHGSCLPIDKVIAEVARMYAVQRQDLALILDRWSGLSTTRARFSYAQGISDCVDGNLAWYRLSSRYRQQESPSSGPPAAIIENRDQLIRR